MPLFLQSGATCSAAAIACFRGCATASSVSGYGSSLVPWLRRQMAPLVPSSFSVTYNRCIANIYTRNSLLHFAVSKLSNNTASIYGHANWISRYMPAIRYDIVYRKLRVCLFFIWVAWVFIIILYVALATIIMFKMVAAPYGLRGSNAPWFICWFRHYRNCLFVYLTYFLTFFVPYILSSLLI